MQEVPGSAGSLPLASFPQTVYVIKVRTTEPSSADTMRSATLLSQCLCERLNYSVLLERTDFRHLSTRPLPAHSS